MRTITIVAALVALTMGAAKADVLRSHCTYNQYSGYVCNSSYGPEGGGYTPPPEKLTKKQAATEAAEQKAKEERWLAFCKPQRVVDNEGVTRLLYAEKGCEFGRSE
jgi:hypothetical protein